MADERNQWLDQEAAERLLRGLPVEDVDDHTRDRVERLARALDAARPAALASAAEGELPGESAALAAFRAAAAERAAASRPEAATATPPLPVPADGELAGVRIAPPAAARRWGRSLRFGLAAAVAAVAVGGVAVAAGTGVLSTPFDETPAPAGSVTVAESPRLPVSVTPREGAGTVTPSAPSEGESPASGPSVPPVSPGVTQTPEVTGGPTAGTPEPGPSAEGPDRDAVALRTKIVEACQDYQAGHLSERDRRRLTDSARTGETVRRYCDRVLAGATTGPGASRGASAGGSGRSSGGAGDDVSDDVSGGAGDRASGGSGRGDEG